ncbi:MAG: DUF86 domain-containing protein [Cytophagales bacterium]|nr:DUF86 domain-containing protein [Cytophagales bacterium]
MRDKAYEQQVNDIQQQMMCELEELKEDIGSWKTRDLLAAQRALQVVIESLVGVSRYVYLQRYGISVSKSRQGLDGLLNRGDINQNDHKLAMKMLGFRNVLVHDYLEVNRAIVESILKNDFYQDVRRISSDLMEVLEVNGGDGGS